MSKKAVIVLAMAQIESNDKEAMKLAHELMLHTEQYASGWISDLKWRTLESKHKAERLSSRIKLLDEMSDALRENLAIRESLGISDE